MKTNGVDYKHFMQRQLPPEDLQYIYMLYLAYIQARYLDGTPPNEKE